jgi:hypothetical protein
LGFRLGLVSTVGVVVVVSLKMAPPDASLLFPRLAGLPCDAHPDPKYYFDSTSGLMDITIRAAEAETKSLGAGEQRRVKSAQRTLYVITVVSRLTGTTDD